MKVNRSLASLCTRNLSVNCLTVNNIGINQILVMWAFIAVFSAYYLHVDTYMNLHRIKNNFHIRVSHKSTISWTNLDF